jgi:prolyl oligopeptidase
LPGAPLSTVILLTAAIVWATALCSAADPGPPPTRTEDVVETIHGLEISDPYRWLEDQEHPDTRRWIDAQMDYTREMLDSWPGREGIRQRLEAILRVESVGRPVYRNGRYFYLRRSPDDDLSVLCMREGDGPEKVLIDPHRMNAEGSISVRLMGVARDGGLLAYGLRRGGEDEVALRLFDVARGGDLPDSMPRGRYSGVEFTPDGLGFYYTLYGDQGERVFRHTLGNDPDRDSLMFGEGLDPGMGVGIDLSEDGRYLLMIVYHGSAAERSDVYVIDLGAGTGVEALIEGRDAYFTGTVAGGRVFLKTDWDAPNGRIIAVRPAGGGLDGAKEIVPESEAVLTGFTAAGGLLLVRYLEDVIPSIRVFEPDGSPVAHVEPPSIGYLSAPGGSWNEGLAFFSFSSFHTPTTIYSYDLSSFEKSVWARKEVPIDTEDFEVEQVWYRSHDGTRVPMFLAYRKGIRLDGGNPALLTGYGGFRSSMLPYFSSTAAVWLSMGGVYALPNLRGGGEFGEEWHRAGMRRHKQNTFDDFTAAAEWLTREGYTSPDRLAIRGGSNGGLLVGAALTQRPDLFRAVICTYPLLDMVRYQRFLLGRFWVSEYGSAEDPEQLRYILDYSPYHNVVPGTEYPAVMFVTGDSDTRVAPLHARKMTALLQASTGSDNPVLLHYDTSAGHSGGRPLSMVIDDLADQFVFLAWQLGLDI